MRHLRLFMSMFVMFAVWAGKAAADDAGVDFARHIKPIFEKSCGKCHGADKQQGGLRFDRKEGALRAGESGSQAIAPGKSSESELIRRVEAADASERMPLEAEPLPAEQIKLLRTWIEQGADWPVSGAGATAGRGEMVVTDDDRRHWSYRPLATTIPPLVQDAAWCQTPIDRFIRAAQEAKGISPNPPASRRTLIRRVYFDLIGLPPSPEEVEAFVADPSPRAYEELVDRLLTSRHYGERWGRHIKGGTSFGETDEIGYKAAVDPVTVHDLHATMLHLLGIDHNRLTYLHNGRRYRLTDVAGNVLTKILA